MSSSKNEKGENKVGATMAKSRVKAIKVLSSVIRQGSDEAMVQQDALRGWSSGLFSAQEG